MSLVVTAFVLALRLSGIQLGGSGSSYTDAINNGNVLLPGLVSYNLSSSSSSSGSNPWSNTSSTAFAANYQLGSAACLPPYGRMGLAVFIGGLSENDDYTEEYVALNNVSFYDPQSGHWH